MSNGATSPARMSLMNLDTSESIEAQYNPDKWDYEVGANYTAQDIVGMSHQMATYHHTENPKVTLELLLQGETPEERQKLDCYGRWLEAFLYPRRGKLGPPRMMLVWPGEASLICHVHKLHLGRKRFNVQLQCVEMNVKLDLVPVRDVRLYGDEVEMNGLKRGT